MGECTLRLSSEVLHMLRRIDESYLSSLYTRGACCQVMHKSGLACTRSANHDSFHVAHCSSKGDLCAIDPWYD